jgi:nitrogen fixation/metabolism regulation signal transduction histidine kinase
MNRVFLRRLGLAVVCGVAGLALNRWRIGTAAPLLFGRVATLPIAILFGPWFGAAAAIIAALPATPTALSPAILVLPVEAVVVGAFARRGRSPLVAGVLVWMAIAATLVTVPSLYGVGYLRQSILPVALQVILSGLVAIVIADLIATGASAQRLVAHDAAPGERRLRSYAFHAFVLVATLPVLILAAVDGQITAAKQEADGRARLHEAVTALGEHIREYVADHEHAVQALALTMADPALGAAERQQVVDRYHAIYPGFITIFVADRAGVVHQLYPRRQAEPPAIADRDYFTAAMQAQRVAVSDVIVGRLSHVPIVTIAVPVFDGGAPVGVAGGSLDLSQFQRFVADFKTLADARVSILDRRDLVIYASGQTSFGDDMVNLAADSMVVSGRAATSGVFDYRSASTGAAQIAAVTTIAPLQWKVYIEQPLLTLRLQSTGYYAFTLALMLLALGGAVFGARAFSSAVTRPLEEVVTVVRNISAHGGSAEVKLPSTPPAEIAGLLDDVNGMQRRLADSYQQL